MKTSRMQEALSKGKTVYGINSMWPSGGIIEAIGGAWDFIWIDGQHGRHDYQSLTDCVRACEIVNTSALIRVPGQSYEHIGLALDLAAAGVIVPMVDNVEQAKQVIASAKFAPLGKRSFGGRRIIDLYSRDYVHEANERQMLLCQVETQEGVKNAEAIAALEGVDCLFYGPDDMKVSLGLPMTTPTHTGKLGEWGEHVAKAANDAGKFALVPATNPDTFRWAVDAGFRAIVLGGDKGFAILGSQSAMAIAEEHGPK